MLICQSIKIPGVPLNNIIKLFGYFDKNIKLKEEN